VTYLLTGMLLAYIRMQHSTACSANLGALTGL